MIKLKVRESSIFYGKEKAKSRRTDETKQYDTITYVEKKKDGTMSPILKGELEQKLIEAKENLEKLHEYKTQGTILQSKTRWYNEGEKNSKYFFNLEKRKQTSRQARMGFQQNFMRYYGVILPPF